MRVHPETMPGELAETTRRYPRSLRQAFPISEDQRDGVEHVATSDRWSRLSDRVHWVVGCLLLAWLAWACFHVTMRGAS